MQDDDEEIVEKEPVFHYSRERRLQHASALVREMNEDQNKKKGLLISLFGNKSNIVFFLCILLICFFTFAFSRLPFLNRTFSIGGNTLIMNILEESGIRILSIEKRAASGGEVYIGPVEITVNPSDSESSGSADSPPFMHRINFNPSSNELFLITLPFNSGDFFVSFSAGNEQRTARVRE